MVDVGGLDLPLLSVPDPYRDLCRDHRDGRHRQVLGQQELERLAGYLNIPKSLLLAGRR